MSVRLLDLPSELLVDIAKFLPPIQRSRTLPSLCKAMYEVELMSWSCQTSKTCTVIGRRAKEACIERFSSLQEAVRQAIIRNSDSIMVRNIYISSVFSIMAHTILAKAIGLADSEQRKMQHLMQALTLLSDQAIGVIPSERGIGSIIARKRILPRTALEYGWRDHHEVDRLRIMKTFVEKIIACDVHHPPHRRFELSIYQERHPELPGWVDDVREEVRHI